ncbi:alpha-L-rhamnosidase-related protein [Streptomyces montanisoli]|uniref:Discoidin domain-containing protein n=1 Tax=Streptomyces montanisoli TaxID=2798581 RepID=A0A940MC55_9ACTN|nr:alpha-L-rhamnosidase C-terminal domain-containing protein [Streptomyces montanisoli]MBP0458569.1 discoidin domain-containing protein [Streptomyces montanisoli]
MTSRQHDDDPAARSGPARRAVLAAGAAGAAVGAVALGPFSGTAFAARPGHPGRPPHPAQGAGAWHRYVQGPSSRTVRPARVLPDATTGDVRDADALLKPGGRPAVLTRPRPAAPPAWPDGTTAEASSAHAPNGGNDGNPRTYDAKNAIDGDPDTFWNDDTQGAYPDTLTITLPAAHTLPGVTVLSNADGVPTAFTVDTWDGGAWQRAATVTGNTAVQRPVPFAAPVTTTAVRITVTADQATPQGEFTRVNEVWPDVVPVVEPPSVTVDFGKVVVGYPRVRFAYASGNNPGVRLAFSESTKFLTTRSDFTRGDQAGDPGHGTDQFAVPAKGAEWRDDHRGYQAGDDASAPDKVYADGLHGFRYLRITLDALASDAPAAQPWGTVAVDSVSLDFTAYVGTPESYGGWFLSSDDELNRYWYAAAYTNELVTDHFRRDDVDPRNAYSPTLDGKLVLHDGAKRDRDPYVGDLAVSARTLYLTHVDAAEAARNVLADLADHQRADGWIPPASINNYTLPLFDYPLWWVTCSWDYVLYTGDRAYAAAYYPHLLKVLDTWYPSVTDSAGLLSKGLNGTSGYGDYAFLGRTGRVTYYNANYVQALKDAASLAGFLGHTSDAARWRDRADAVAKAVNAHLWDEAAGAYLDSATGAVRHAQDGNSIAITAGVADADRAGSALDHLDATTKTRYGNAFMDNDTLFGGASQRVYAFTSYPELVARFRTGRADSAIDQIRRTYGWMASHDPGITHWEGIGPGGSLYEDAYTSCAHGWSTGVLPALTNQLLGAVPTAPGFAEWAVRPCPPASLSWAEGQLPTPHGPLTVRWDREDGGGLTLTVHAPHGTRGSVAVPVDGAATRVRAGRTVVWDGRRARVKGVSGDGSYVTVTGLGPGTHTFTTGR